MAEDPRSPIINVDGLARRAAILLVDEHPAVVPQVEALLQSRGEPSELQRFDPAAMITLGGLVVTVAQFAYLIWRDRKRDKQLTGDALKRRVRIALDDRGYPDTTQQARVIDAVVRAIEDAQR